MNKEQFDELFKKVKSELDKEMVEKIIQDKNKMLESGKELGTADIFNLTLYESSHFASELVYRVLSEVLVDDPS